jgi:hypothetical protein
MALVITFAFGRPCAAAGSSSVLCFILVRAPPADAGRRSFEEFVESDAAVMAAISSDGSRKLGSALDQKSSALAERIRNRSTRVIWEGEVAISSCCSTFPGWLLRVLLNSSLKKAPHNGGLPVSEQPTHHAADQSDRPAPAATAIVAGITRAAMTGGFVAETCRRLRDVFA